MTSIALVVPSYGRPDQLARCLRSVREQERPFDEVVVVTRTDDERTLSLLADSSVRVVSIDEPGVLAAMAAGASATNSEIIAFTDDDARLTPAWARRLLELFALPENRDVGAIGGRDLLHDGDVARPTTLTERVGVVTRFGRLVGNHHRGAGHPRDVDVLKGVNAAYRRSALGLPTSLRGTGAQAHFEVAVGRFARASGWRLRYYPDLVVQHHPAERLGEDQRGGPSDQAVYDSAYNLMRGLAPSIQSRRWLYVHLVGDRACPGLLRCALALVARDRATLDRRRASWRATTDAWRRRREPERYLTF